MAEDNTPEWKKHWTETQAIHVAADQVQENIRSMSGVIAKQNETIRRLKAGRGEILFRDLAPMLSCGTDAFVKIGFVTNYGNLWDDRSYAMTLEQRKELVAKYGGFAVHNIGTMHDSFAFTRILLREVGDGE